MAKQTGIIKFSGKLNNIIGYRNGKDYCLRSQPAAIKQTSATKRTARDFGTASKSAKLIRHALPKINDSKSINRLNKALGEIVRNDKQHQAGRRQITADAITALRGFRFNSYASISCIPVIEKNNKEISISITEKFTKIRAIALSLNFQQQTTKLTSVEYDGQQPIILHTNNKDITLILLEIQKGSGLNRKEYALDIIAVYPPQQEQTKKIKKTRAPKLMVIPHYTKRVTQLFASTPVQETSPPGK